MDEPIMITQKVYDHTGKFLYEEQVPWTPPPVVEGPPTVWNQLADSFREGVNSI